MPCFSQKLSSFWRVNSISDYSILPGDEHVKHDVEKGRQSPAHKYLSLSWWFHTSVYLMVMFLAAFGLYTLVRTQFHVQQLSCNCGDTLDEALKNDCVYDSLAAAWLPPHCLSEALSLEFESSGPNPPDAWGNTWPYWADANKTKPLTLEDVSRLPMAGPDQPSHFFATYQWHIMHCVFYWRKMWDSAQRTKGIFTTAGESEPLLVEKRYDTLMHINHCKQMFLKRNSLDAIATEAGVALHSDEIHISKPYLPPRTGQS